MFTATRLRRDIEGAYGILEQYSVYNYGGSTRLRALIALNYQVKDGEEVYEPNLPAIFFQHTLTSINKRTELGGNNLERAAKYVKAKKPIFSILDENSLVVGIEVNPRKGEGKVVVYTFEALPDSDILILRPSSFTLPFEVEKRLVGMLRNSKGDRTKFLASRMGEDNLERVR